MAVVGAADPLAWGVLASSPERRCCRCAGGSKECDDVADVVVGSDAFERFFSVHLGHVVVEHQEVDALFGGLVEALGSGLAGRLVSAERLARSVHEAAFRYYRETDDVHEERRLEEVPLRASLQLLAAVGERERRDGRAVEGRL